MIPEGIFQLNDEESGIILVSSFKASMKQTRSQISAKQKLLVMEKEI